MMVVLVHGGVSGLVTGPVFKVFKIVERQVLSLAGSIPPASAMLPGPRMGDPRRRVPAPMCCSPILASPRPSACSAAHW
jgi:hypothetical protein